MRQIYNWIAKAIILMVIMTSITHADEIKFKKITLVPSDKVWLLSAEINLELSPALEQLVKKGVTLHFVTEFQLTKGRWYWFDEKVVDVQRTSKISYQALTDQYRVTLGSVTITAANLKQAMGAVSSIDDWAVIEQPMVSPNQTYVAATYDFGILKAYAQWINRKAVDTLNTNYFANRTAQQIGVRGNFTSNIDGWASIGNGKVSAFGASQPTANFTGFQLGSNYYLSKRTNLYAIYGKNQTSSVSASLGAVSGSNYAVGVRHTF